MEHFSKIASLYARLLKLPNDSPRLKSEGRSVRAMIASEMAKLSGDWKGNAYQSIFVTLNRMDTKIRAHTGDRTPITKEELAAAPTSNTSIIDEIERSSKGVFNGISVSDEDGSVSVRWKPEGG